ncbi:hypothetical protein ACFPVX_23575 [Cohnella faecalis]|nr:hypothetical protein [Cohnella faecalis]
MMDLYMALLLAVTFGLFYGFAIWCDRVVDDGETGETGGGLQ